MFEDQETIETYESLELYRTKDGCCGVVYAKMYPEQLLESELERFMGRTLGSKNRPKDGTEVKAQKDNQVISNIASALQFVGIVSGKDLSAYMEHVKLADGFAIMSNGQLSAGFPIEEDLDLIPNYNLLSKAIKKCGKSLSLTELDSGRLSVKGDNLRAIVPCLDPGSWPSVQADMPVATVGEPLRQALAVCGVLASENAERVFEASVLLEAYQCTSTNGNCVMQFWHGIDLPPALVVPKSFIQAITKAKGDLVAFGWTQDTSITFYFAGGAWIKTLLYADKWPEVSHIIDKPFEAVTVPKEFFNGVDAVTDFNENEYVTLSEGLVKSNESTNVGAQYDVKGLASDKVLSGKQLRLLEPFITAIDFNSYPDRIFFSGDSIRGVLMAILAGGEG
jgi:hypothetical protein